jgi:quinoprotein glucose dehydrogenase
MKNKLNLFNLQKSVPRFVSRTAQHMKNMALALLFSCLIAGCLRLNAQWPEAGQDHTSWSDYGGGEDSSQYSSLRQINRTNVSKLQVAWVYPTGDHSRYFFNPIQARGLTYVLAANNSIVALDAATGKEVWVHKGEPHTSAITDRGMNYWESKDGRERRILFSCNQFLREIDARTGKTILTFGRQGGVNLKAGLGRDPKLLTVVQSMSPGRVFENLIILGSATNQGYGSAPGDIRAFDVRTGKLVWTFHTIPRPGEFGNDTWPKDAWKRVGGANCWSEMSIDMKRGIIYIPTGSPKYNFYGADRAGADLFGDCLLALDARTGKRLWHYQMVHHDIWDYDNATEPKLLTVMHNGQKVDAVAQPGKTGFVWVFNRETGEPLWPIEERPEPRSDMPGEETWPTQPFPLKPPPFARQVFTSKDLSPYIDDPQELARFRQVMDTANNQGLFTPPGLRDTIQMPGNSGGANWGGAAVDPADGTLYVVSMDLPCLLKLEPEVTLRGSRDDTPEQKGHFIFESDCRSCHGADLKGMPPGIPSLAGIGTRLSREKIEGIVRQGRGPMPGFPKLSQEDLQSLAAFLANPAGASTLPAASATTSTADPASGKVHYLTGFGFMLTSAGVSAIAPPWSSLNAYDLNEGTIKWQVPFGEVPELAAKGIKNTGFPFTKTGPVVTAGGLIFTATRDHMVRALDEETGKVLWEHHMETGMQGIPSVYEVNGVEYLVVCAAAPEVSDTAAQANLHGAYVAFALPKDLR